MLGEIDRGTMFGFAVGIGRRMRSLQENHAEDIYEHRTQINRLIEQRDNHATHLIAYKNQIAAMTNIISTILENLPENHPLNKETKFVDINGQTMNRVQVEIGLSTLENTLNNSFVYHNTLKHVASLVGIDPENKKGWELRKILYETGDIEIGFSLEKSIKA